MKKYISLFIVAISFIFLTSSMTAADTPPSEQAVDESIFTIYRMMIAGSVEDREPVGVVDAFAASTDRVYCFLEARKISEDYPVTFVWYHGEKKMAGVELTLRQGSRWRTYSSKRLGGLTGDWKVELQDSEGTVLHTVGFTVE